MNLAKVRRRLTVHYAVLMAAVVGAGAIYVSVVGADRIRSEAEREAEQTVRVIARAPSVEDLDIANAWIVNPNGEWNDPVGEPDIEPPLFSLAEQAMPDDATVFQNYSQDGGSWLLHAEPLNAELAVVTAVELSAYESRILAFRLTALVAALAAIGLSSLASSWLAGRSLAPARVALDNQRDFVADAAHEMRTPLAVIQAAASHALSRDRDPAEYRQSLEEIRAASTRASAGVGELLELARLDAGQAQPRLAPLRLDLLVDEVASSVIVDGVNVTATTPIEPVVAAADYLLLRQALENLVRNAAARGTEVVVAVERSATDTAVVTVSDDGPGFDPDLLPTLFERFRRGDSKGGAGLGLAIARSIVDLHGGTIAARNGPDGGAVVVVTLSTET